MRAIIVLSACLATILLCFWLLLDVFDKPIVYDSWSSYLAGEEHVCVFVDDKGVRKDCTSFTDKERSMFEHRWAR